MRWAIIAAGVTTLVVLVIAFLRSRPPLNCRSLIEVRAGNCRFSGEALPRHVREAVTEMVRDAGVNTGFIAITPDRRVTFSRHVPESIQQRLRNVILNP